MSMSDRPSRREQSSRKSRPRRRNQILFVLGILLLAGGAFYTALVVATQIEHIFFPGTNLHIGGLSNLPLVKTDNSSEIGGGRINILVLGLDRRPSEADQPTRTDTMFVMTVDPSSHSARGLALPRDLYVDIPSKTGNTNVKDRINTAYERGELFD